MSPSERRPRGLLAGAAAGLVGLACCVGPAVAALLGLTSAAVAADLANTLYSQWGWAFKLAGISFAAGAVWLARRRARACPVDRRPNLKRFAAVLVVTGLAFYGGLYALTSWLEKFGETEPLHVTGATQQERVSTAATGVFNRHPHVVVEVIGITPERVMFRVGWTLPEPTVDDYPGEIAERVRDQREATLLLLEAAVRSAPTVRFVGAFEDNLFVPVWSRRQIIEAKDPALYRDWPAYARFQRSAARQLGYAQLDGGFGR
ncbi:MAG: hypothetical protein ACRDK3_13335 [Actinomycetota bacterium]